MEILKHECGVAMIRLRKPLRYYEEKYGNPHWGLDKLYLLMEKQHNRGQEGAGLCVADLNAPAGREYMFRERALGSNAITEIFENIKKRPEARGQLYMGHLRYSTTGRSGIDFVHPFMRRNNWKAKNLALCGNFNMTNVNEIFAEITSKGQHPRIKSDTYIMLEQVGHRLDRESERLFRIATDEFKLQGSEITQYIEDNIDIFNVFATSAPLWDGGFVICAITGSGEMGAIRDSSGIRTAFWYMDDEVFVLASERPVIQTAFNVECDAIHELSPGESIVMTKHGELRRREILPKAPLRACSFERIYFSRGGDKDIYAERKNLGRLLTPQILRSIDRDVSNTVFGYIPNTAEVAFYGMIEGVKAEYNHIKTREILDLDHKPSEDELNAILNKCVRIEKVAIKDIKLRTFITEESGRSDLSAHVYDVTYGSLRPGLDNLVIIDDSIVRGTTLRESVIAILDRLHPRKMVLVSSAPQVRYPDYYGIDMAKLDEFIAFRAAMQLLAERNMANVAVEVFSLCLAQRGLAPNMMKNYVKNIYAPFSAEEISRKMVEMLRPTGVKTPIEIIFQTPENLRKACPNHSGDWYFSGDYPTPGGLRLLNEAYINYYQRKSL